MYAKVHNMLPFKLDDEPPALPDGQQAAEGLRCYAGGAPSTGTIPQAFKSQSILNVEAASCNISKLTVFEIHKLPFQQSERSRPDRGAVVFCVAIAMSLLCLAQAFKTGLSRLHAGQTTTL